MLTVKPIQMFLLGQTWHQVVDETGASLGAIPTESGAQHYKARLESRGINSAQDMLAIIPDPRRRANMRDLMLMEGA